jgi:hypothetical protein
VTKDLLQLIDRASALAHTIENKVKAAYRRGDLFEKRRRPMIDWTRFCEVQPTGEVVPIGQRRT